MTSAAVSASLVLGLLVALPAGAGTLSPNLRKGLTQVERLLLTWQVVEAERTLAPLVRVAPDHPRVLQLRAELLLHKGEYEEGLRVAREAARRARTNLRIKALRNLLASTVAQVKGYASGASPGGHFRLFAPKGKDELLFPFAGEVLEAVRERVQQQLGYAPSDPIRVEVYPGPEALAQVSPLTLDEIQRSGTIALCKYNRLMIVTPRALLQGYSWLDTLAHEYVHLVVSRVSHNSVPVWLHEGIAKYLEAVWRLPAGAPPPLSPAQEHLLAEALRGARFIRWEQMHPSMAKLPDQRATALAFAEVQTAVEFIAHSAVGRSTPGRSSARLPLPLPTPYTYGANPARGAPSALPSARPRALREMIDALRSGKTDWAAIQAATGLERAAFDQGWRRHLRGRNLRRLTGLVPLELRFGKQPTKEQRIAAVREVRARKFLRLAELLRGHGLTAAAVIEYVKARSLLGPRDDLVSNHLARAYLELSSPAQAISALLPVVEYYPEIPGPQTTLGVAYLRSGDPRAAERHFKAALRVNPFDPEIHCGLAAALKASAPTEAARHSALCSQLE